MINIGIDIAKHKHCMAAIGEGGEIIIKNFVFCNTTQGFTYLLNAFVRKSISCNNAKICIELTGHYGHALREHLEDLGFEVSEVNPILTHNWNKALSVRKVKNDAVDALGLAKWASVNATPVQMPTSKNLVELKSLARSRTFHTEIIGDSKRKAKAILDETFPEFAGFFSDDFGKAGMAIMKKWPTADLIAHARIDSLTKCLSKASKGKHGRAKAEELKELARNSFASTSKTSAQALQLKQLITLIEFTQDQIAEIDKMLAEMLTEINTPIMSVPGVGSVCGAIILGEIGEISRFSKASQLVAFSGYDPSVYESGKFKGTKNHISKRGSKYLRWALWIAADRARMHDPVFKEFYEKKRDDGKCHKVATCAVARKLCNTIFAVLRDDEPYKVNQS